jgi:hypothetical protein
VGWSFGRRTVSPGSESITGEVFSSPDDGGAGGLMATSGVPLSAAGLMPLSGLAGLAALRRKRAA